jgi:hypothetical protein
MEDFAGNQSRYFLVDFNSCTYQYTLYGSQLIILILRNKYFKRNSSNPLVTMSVHVFDTQHSGVFTNGR